MVEKKQTIDEKRMSLVEHLEELRHRLLVCAAAAGVGFGTSYSFSQDMFAVLMAPLVKALPPESSLIFTGSEANLPRCSKLEALARTY